jgi:hypothetical protein
MMIEIYSNMLFLARKTRPQALTAKDGTFALQMLVYSSPSSNTKVPWRITWFGEAALHFWQTHGAALTPGAALEVELTRLALMDGVGRYAGAEMHAHVTTLKVLPKPRKCAEDDAHFSYTKTPASA